MIKLKGRIIIFTDYAMFQEHIRSFTNEETHRICNFFWEYVEGMEEKKVPGILLLIQN